MVRVSFRDKRFFLCVRSHELTLAEKLESLMLASYFFYDAFDSGACSRPIVRRGWLSLTSEKYTKQPQLTW